MDVLTTNINALTARLVLNVYIPTAVDATGLVFPYARH